MNFNRCYQKKLIVIFLLVLILAPGNKKIFAASLPYSPKNMPSYSLNRTTYVPLLLVCDNYAISWEWDPIGKVVILKKNGLEARLKVGSYRAYANGKITNLEKPPLFHNGVVVVPISFTEKTIDKIFKEQSLSTPFARFEPISAKEKRYVVSTVVIDPGHGGRDPGAIGRSGLREKDVVLEIAKELKRQLEQYGINAILTRDNDAFIPLGRRATVANNLKATFFISVHANSSRSKNAKGFEVYCLSDATDDSTRALAAAENASLKYEEESFDDSHTKNLDAIVCDIEFTENRKESKELASSICNSVLDKLAVRKRGVKGAGFYVLKGARMPAVLIEIGFVSNKEEASSLSSTYYKKKLTEALVDGILNYKREYEKTNGFTE